MISISRTCLPVLAVVIVSGCKQKPEQAPAPAATSAAVATVPPKPALPPEPQPPVADKASEVPGLEAVLAKDAAYQAVWSGARADLDAFLTYTSELFANRGVAPKPLGDAVRAKKLGDAGVKLFMIVSRVGKFPDNFSKKLAAHLDATKTEPHMGTWSVFTKGGRYHDYTALAAWARYEDPAYLREHLAAKKEGAGPFPWGPWSGKEPPLRSWLVEEGAALERLALLTKLMPDEEERLESVRAVAKKEAAEKTEIASAVSVTARELFAAYEANEVSADEKYKSKKLLVTGTVSSIDKGGITGEAIMVKLTTPNEFMPVNASMEDDEKPKTAKLSKGDPVRLLCAGGAMKVIGFVQLSDCSLR